MEGRTETAVQVRDDAEKATEVCSVGDSCVFTEGVIVCLEYPIQSCEKWFEFRKAGYRIMYKMF